MKTMFLVPENSQNINVVRDFLYGAWCSGNLLGGTTVPPLPLISVATVAKQAGMDVTVVDMPAENISMNQLNEKAREYNAIVMLTSFMTFREDIVVLNRLKKRNPYVRVVLFGAQPTFQPEFCLQEDVVNVIVMNEPEYVIRDLLLSWRDAGDWKKIPGVAFRESNTIHTNSPYPYIKNLDDLPIPDRSLLSASAKYFNPLVEKYPYTTMFSSRGCASECIYCTAPYFMGRTVRAHSAEYVFKEMCSVFEQGYRTVHFRDETFCAFRERNIELCQRLLSAGIRLKWAGNAIPGELDREYLTLMKRAGLYLLKFGVENGNDKILQRAKRKVDCDKIKQDFALCKELSIRTHAHCMIGMPGETRKTVNQTFELIDEIKTDTVIYTVCSPYPGTPLFEEIKKKCPSIAHSSTIDLDLKNLHIKPRYNEMYTELKNMEIRMLVQKGYMRFYARPCYIVKALLKVRSMRGFFNLFKAGARVLLFGFTGKK